MMTRASTTALLFLSTACVETRESPFLPPAATTASGETGMVSGASGEPDDESGSSGFEPTVDMGEPDSPAPQCASISQTTTIEERPSDIIIIADDDMDRVFVQDNVTNLLPGMESEGVFDASVTLVVSGDAPDDPDNEFSCGAWNCRGASSFGAFLWLDRSVSADAVLSNLIDLRADWTPALRESSWKHIWVMATNEADAMLTADAFLAELDDLSGVVLHATVSAEGEGAPQGYAGLAEQTGGAYSQGGDYNLFDFQTPMIERIQGTALACEYDIPEPPDGLVFVRDKVNVLYDEGAGPLPIGFVETANDCLTVGYGWHYDDTVAPTQIIMCPESCGRFDALTEATIDIQFGCDTIPAA